MTIDDILDTLEEDLTWGQRWLDSAADSSSDFPKIIDQTLRTAKNAHPDAQAIARGLRGDPQMKAFMEQNIGI